METTLCWGAWLVGGGALALGFGLGLLSRRRVLRISALRRAGEPGTESALEGLPALRGARQLWVVPDTAAQERLILAATALAACHRPVLLAPAPASRAALEPSDAPPAIVRLEELRPTVEELLEAARSLAWMGPPLLLVQGADALEEISEGEASDTVVRDLLADCPNSYDLLIIELDTTPMRTEPQARIGAEHPALVPTS
jgi:hypothetical protein